MSLRKRLNDILDINSVLDVVSYYLHSKTVTLSTTKPIQWHVHPAKTGIIRIFNGCGVQIEYFVIPSDGSSSLH